jgi:hypothetical protein
MFNKIKKAARLYLFGTLYTTFVMSVWLAVIALAGERVNDLWLILITVIAYEIFGFICAERRKKELERDTAIAMAQAIKNGILRYDGPTPRKEAESEN